MTDRWTNILCTDTKQRIDEIDIAKALGIACVLAGHRGTAGAIHNYIYLFHMPLFFILSGYMMKKEKLSFLHIFFRENKLISSYVVYSLIYILFDCVKNRDLHSLVSDVIDTCTLYGTHTLWFLSSLWIVKCIIRVIDKVDCNSIKHVLICVIHVACYWLSIFLQSLNYSGYVGQLAESISWSIVRAGVILIFVYCGYVFKNCISMYIVFYRGHIIRCFCSILITGLSLIPFVRFESINYSRLENGLFIFNIFCGIIGTFFILGISIVAARFFKIIKEVLVNVGKSSIHYVASESFGFSGCLKAFLSKIFSSFPYIQCVSFGVYVVVLYCVIWLIGPLIDKVINTVARKLEILEKRCSVKK